jgi:zinc transport system ATP-binding protein
VLRHGKVVHDGAPPPARHDHDRAGHRHQHPHADDNALDAESRALDLEVRP